MTEINYKGYKITMKGLNHFECKALKLFGYSSLNTLKRKIDKFWKE